jgi:head-tail adaptor
MRLNRRLVLEEVERVPDGAGGFAELWVARGTLWGQVKAGSGRDAVGEFATLSTVPYRITVRAAPPGAPSRPKPDQRFREGARMFRILAVTEEEGAGTYLVCFAREEVAA